MGVSKKNVIGIFGGTFDPPHLGHLKISVIGLKKFKLKKLYWIVTKKNPFKKTTFFSLKERLKKCKIISENYKKIKVVSYDHKIKSSRIIDAIEYLQKKERGKEIKLILGSDNLVHFHKWKKYKKILKFCQLIIFARKGYDLKAKKSKIMKNLDKKNIIFVKNRKIDISSTKLRKNII